MSEVLSAAWTFYRMEFVGGFLARPLIPGVLVLLAALLFGWIGKEYGVSYLLRHEHCWKQFFAGFALSALCCKLLFLGFVLRAKDAWTSRPDFPDQRLFHDVVGYVLSILATAAAFALLAYLCNLGRNGDAAKVPPKAPKSARRPWLPLALGCGLVVALFVLVLLVPQHFGPLERLVSAFGRGLLETIRDLGLPVADDVPPTTHYLHGALSLSVLAVSTFYAAVSHPRLRRRFSAATPVFFLLNLVTSVYGYLAYHAPELLPAAVLVLAALVILGGRSRYSPGLSCLAGQTEVRLGDSEKPAAQTASQEAGLLSSEEIAFCKHGLGPHQPNHKRPMVLLCVSGGGLAAAAWALAMLHRLERDFKKSQILFPYHVRLVTGASGGMVGAAQYAATLPPPNEWADRDHVQPYTLLTEDCLSPVVHQLVYGDLLGFPFPFRRTRDRGEALETAWRDNLTRNGGTSPLDKTFADLAESERDGWRPSLVFSPMMVEDGRRLLVSNLDLAAVACQRGNRIGEDVLSKSALELFRLFPSSKKGFPLGTAARMSATFPFVTPATVLPTIPRRRVVDAGYYDNFGVSLATMWLAHNLGWVQRNASGVLILQVRGFRREDEARMESAAMAEGAGSTALSRGLEGIVSPLEGVLAMRRSAALFRNDETLGLLSAYFNEQRLRPFLTGSSPEQLQTLAAALGLVGPEKLQTSAHDLSKIQGLGLHFDDTYLREVRSALDRDKSRYFMTEVLEYPGEASVSWYLTTEEREAIRSAAFGEDGPLKQRIEGLMDWWQKLPQGEACGQS